MKRALLVSTLCVSALSLGGGLAPAEASGNWFVAADFAVGGAYFSLGYQQPAYGYPGYYAPQPVYYYRVDRPLPYPGLHCTSACYLRDRHYYHHPSCPLVAHHFRRYDYRPRWGYSGPVVHYRPYYPARPYYWHDRRGWDDWDDYRGHRGHGWGHYQHRHHRGCGHDDD